MDHTGSGAVAFRAASYVAIVAIAAIIATSALVWDGVWRHRVLRQVAQYALAATAVLAVVQLLVFASDIEGTAPWSAWGGVSVAFETDAGTAFGIRILLLGFLGTVLYLVQRISEQTRWLAAGAGTVMLLGTWALAGHSRSMRWPLLGIPLDIAHHAAAAAWLGGLAIVGLVAARECSVSELTGVVQRFAQLAAVSVGVIVGTGLLQGVRLVGNPARLFDADHGRYLVAVGCGLESPSRQRTIPTPGDCDATRRPQPASRDGDRARRRPHHHRHHGRDGRVTARRRRRGEPVARPRRRSVGHRHHRVRDDAAHRHDIADYDYCGGQLLDRGDP